MTSTPMQAMARAVSALVADHDVTDVLTRLLFDALDVMDAAAAGLLILRPDGSLEVLTATSHRALDLEMYEAQERVGPCAEAIATNASVVSEGAEMHERWPVFAASMEASGYHAVQAHPLRWHGRVLGAINVFHAGESCSVDEAVGQAFADVATLGVLTPAELDGAEINQLVDTALGDRTVIEQAKGVLAYRERLDMAAAFDRLLEMAGRNGHNLRATAADVVRQAAHPRRS
jgi:hypothetical protein